MTKVTYIWRSHDPGSFSITPTTTPVQVYTGVRNVVARISPRNNGSAAAVPRAALLLNCHFDSVPMVEPSVWCSGAAVPSV